MIFTWGQIQVMSLLDLKNLTASFLLALRLLHINHCNLTNYSLYLKMENAIRLKGVISLLTLRITVGGVDTIASHFWCVGTVTKVFWKQAK